MTSKPGSTYPRWWINLTHLWGNSNQKFSNFYTHIVEKSPVNAKSNLHQTNSGDLLVKCLKIC